MLPALFWSGGILEEEAIGFLRNFWGTRPVLARIFDPRGFDFYQARELSYAIDCLDAQWVRLLLSRGVVLFVPPSALLAALSVVAIGIRLAPRALPALGRGERWLVLLVYLSNFALASSTGLLYRATKPLVAPILLGLLLLVLAEHRRPRLGPRAAFSAVLAAGLAMSLLDRQGLFYLALLAPLLAVAWLRTRRGLPLVLGAAAAIALWALYNYWLGPVIIQALNGYWPEMRFQRLRPWRLLDAGLWLEAARLLGDWARVLAGGLPPPLLAGLAGLGGAAWGWRERRRPGRVALAAGGVVALLAAQLAMVAIMVQRHPPVLWVDHRFWYFPLPFQALLVFLALWGLDALAARGPLPRAAPAALAALVVCNLAQWPERRLVMETGPWFGDVVRRSQLVEESLRDGRAAIRLDGDHRRFYFELLDRFPALASRSLPQVSEGEGFSLPELHDGRVAARATGEAQVVARATEAGPHVLAGALRVSAGQPVQVLLGSRPARLVGVVPPPVRGEGIAFFRYELSLPRGNADLRLLSPQDLTLLAPVLLWRAGDPGQKTAGTQLPR